MAKNQKSEKITIANLIAVVGIVLLLIFSYIGHSYMSGGEMGWDIVISVAITAFTAFLLWFLIKAKGAENNLNLWKKVEYVTLALYILFAVPASLFGGIMHFFVVNDNKENIKMYAEQDLDKIDKLFEDYKAFESEAVSRTGTGLQNATSSGHVCDEKLNNFFEENRIQHTKESAQNFETLQRNALIGSGFEKFYENFLQQRENIQSIVNGWSIIQIPMKSKQMSDLATSVQEELNKLSQNAKLPVITYNEYSGKYTLGENQTSKFNIAGGVESFQFKKAMQEAEGFSVTAILVVLLIHFLILFNYIVAYRTSTLGITKNAEEDGGIILD
jgi:hypothetical protein